MRTLIVSTWTVALLFGGAARAWGQDEARALVERAVKAHGGAEALGRIRADKVKLKGTLILRGQTTPFVAPFSKPARSSTFTMWNRRSKFSFEKPRLGRRL